MSCLTLLFSSPLPNIHSNLTPPHKLLRMPQETYPQALVGDMGLMSEEFVTQDTSQLHCCMLTHNITSHHHITSSHHIISHIQENQPSLLNLSKGCAGLDQVSVPGVALSTQSSVHGQYAIERWSPFSIHYSHF